MLKLIYHLVFPDAPSVNKILPIISPHNLHINSRGRVIFGLLTLDKYSPEIKEYLSPEFLALTANREVKFSESDIEKVRRYEYMSFEDDLVKG